MSSKKIIVAGIGTDTGKTVAAAILCKALQADYWKPIQAGDLHHSDTDKVKALITNDKSKFHENSYGLNTPMSPHAAAEIDGVTIDLTEIVTPSVAKGRDLIIEGAGGLLVPLNDTHTVLDIIPKKAKVIVVSRHVLGSINHTLLTLNLLKEKGFDTYLIYSGDEHPTTEAIIQKMTNTPVIGRIDEEPYFDKNVIAEYAEKFKANL